jgi:Acetyltransferase (GNAT) domain
MRLEEVTETAGMSLNDLPYYICRGNEKIGVHFDLLETADSEEIMGDRWKDAVYRKAWIAFLGLTPHESILKLRLNVTDTSNIEGVVKLGQIPEGGGALRTSLLESTPTNRWSTQKSPVFSGVGRVLVARLIAESYNKGGHGVVTVEPHPAAVGFYQKLGFRAHLKSLKYYTIDATQAAEVFQSATR